MGIDDLCVLRLLATVEETASLDINCEFIVALCGHKRVLRSVGPAFGQHSGLLRLVPGELVVGLADVLDGDGVDRVGEDLSAVDLDRDRHILLSVGH